MQHAHETVAGTNQVLTSTNEEPRAATQIWALIARVHLHNAGKWNRKHGYNQAAC